MENNTTPKDTLVVLREDIKQLLIDLRNTDKFEFPAVAEVTLAQRHLEDARMRLGVALTLLEGNDPLGTR